MLRAVSADGSVLNAEFSLQVTTEGFDATMESRSGIAVGGKPPRNRDYELLMGLIFHRAAALGADLTGAWVASRKTTNLSDAERLLKAEAFPYPIHLPAVSDLNSLRTRLSAAQGAIGRVPGARGPGNRNKRVKLSFRTAVPLNTSELEVAIILGELPSDTLAVPSTKPFATSGQTPANIDLARLQAVLDRYEHAAPRVRQRVQRQVERGPVGDLVKGLNGHHCQICLALGRDGKSFRKRDGQLYVEAHHVEGVASRGRGVLRAANVITVCADHHRELHHGASAEVVDLGDQFRIKIEAGDVIVAKTLMGL